MKKIKAIFELDNAGSAHQFQVITGANTNKDYLFVKKEPGGFKHEFLGTIQEYDSTMRDLLKNRITIFVTPVMEEASLPAQNVTKPSKG